MQMDRQAPTRSVFVNLPLPPPPPPPSQRSTRSPDRRAQSPDWRVQPSQQTPQTPDRRAPSQERRQQQNPTDMRKKPLCFNARSYQKTHPDKLRRRHKDADATLAASMALGVADGVSHLEDFGLDAAKFPRDLLMACNELAAEQLLPGQNGQIRASYSGPVPLLNDAFKSTETHGSATVMLALMDNNTKVMGKPCPMVSIVSVGDCQLLVLRRGERGQPLEVVSHSGCKRREDKQKNSLHVTRVDTRIDPMFREAITVEVIEQGSTVTCIFAKEGDIIIAGTNGVFDNLFVSELVDLCNTALDGQLLPISDQVLGHLAQCIVMAAHAKTRRSQTGARSECPIGLGGKEDDTSVVVAEVVELTEVRVQAAQAESPTRRVKDEDIFGVALWKSVIGGLVPDLNQLKKNTSCCTNHRDNDSEIFIPVQVRDAVFAEDKSLWPPKENDLMWPIHGDESSGRHMSSLPDSRTV